MELGDIATAAFGNDKASEEFGAEDEDDNSKEDIAPCIVISVDNMNDSANKAPNDESEMVRANDSGNKVADELTEHDSEDGHAGSQQKQCYRKQNPSKCCASTSFWTSLLFDKISRGQIQLKNSFSNLTSHFPFPYSIWEGVWPLLWPLVS
jgi:hypothetical protein